MSQPALCTGDMDRIAGATERPLVWLIDEQPEAIGIAETLQHAGFRVARHHFSAAMKDLGSAGEQPCLIILELIQPGVGGLVLCSRLRARTNARIVVYSATRRSRDASACLQLGANAFVHKSSAISELASHIRAALGSLPNAISAPALVQNARLRVGDLLIDLSSSEVFVRGDPVKLTPSQFRLLATLARACGTVVPYTDLVRSLWGKTHVERSRATLAVHVQMLRSKLSRSSTWLPIIEAVRGIGYMLWLPEAERPQESAAASLRGAA
jgi:DNA-binding response OmpR family regulator